VSSSAPAGRDLSLPTPLAFTGMAYAAWRLLLSRSRTLVGLYLLLFVPYLLVATTAVGVVFDIDRDQALAAAVAVFLPVLAFVLLGSLGVVTSAVILADEVAGRSTTIRAALETLRPMRRELLAGALAAALISMMLLFVAPLWLIIAPLLLGPPLVGHVIALEHKTLGDAWVRTKMLLATHWLRIGLYLISFVFAVALVQVPVLVGAEVLLDPLGNDDLHLMLRALATGVAWGLTFPYLAAAGCAAYFDLRARAEGFGPEELRAERAATVPGATPG
jgi:hypothetical protein